MTTPPAPHPHVDSDGEDEQDTASASTPTDGADAARRRLWWVVGTLGVLAMSAVAIWFGHAATAGRVHWNYTGHQVVSDRQVDIRFDLNRDPSRAVVCGLEAQDGTHTVVGRTTVEVGPGESSPSRHIASVQTATRAITGYLTTCWYADEAPRQGG